MDDHLALDSRGCRSVCLSPLHATGYGLRWATFRTLESRMGKSGYVNHVRNWKKRMMTTQPFFNNSVFTTQLFKMEQIYTLFCSFTLFILDFWTFNLINSSFEIFQNFQEFSRTPENIQGQHDVLQKSRTKRVLIANSRTVLGAQGRLATLGKIQKILALLGKHFAPTGVPSWLQAWLYTLAKLFQTMRNGFTKIRTPRRRKNWVDELWKLATATIGLHLVPDQKSELSLND